MSRTIHYFPIVGRNALALVIAEFGSLGVSKNAPEWPAFASQTVFGELPHMEFDGTQVSQSMAMARFLSRKAGFEGKSDADFVMYFAARADAAAAHDSIRSEMLMEHYCDVLNGLVKAAFYAEDKVAAKAKFFETDAPYFIGQLSKIIKEKGGRFTSETTAGEIAAALSVDFLVTAGAKSEEELLGSHPELKAFYVERKPKIDTALTGLSRMS